MSGKPFWTRRGFLRSALGSMALSAAEIDAGLKGIETEAGTATEETTVVAQLRLGRELYDRGAVVDGTISYRVPPRGPVQVDWVDGFGRIVGRVKLSLPASLDQPQPFSFNLRSALTFRNWLRVNVDGTPQLSNARFLVSPPPDPWDDYHAISWAHYPDGFYDLLGRVGVDATIAYRDGDFANVLDNNLDFYVEQMVWEVFANYHKKQPLWKGLLEQVQHDRDNLKLWVRQPCVNDPATDAYVRNHLVGFVRQHRAFRPLFYNIADELGQGDQIKPNDFCHSEYCTVKFAEYLRSMYGTSGQVGREWEIELVKWDDESLRSEAAWEQRDLMIHHTTTDQAFDRIALAGLSSRYGSMVNFNKQSGTSFPEPTGVGMNLQDEWAPVLAVVREARSVATLDDYALEHRIGPLEEANVRWGKLGGWKTAHQPTRFRTWAEVTAFLKRFYSELAEIRSTEGWNVSPWCDFRNFMDATFADAVKRAADVCKAEDPHARCATEGGQCPFAFGWYNYEQVLKAVDVIEPYNIGNNVEVIRSLKPETIMLSTHGFQYTPGRPLTEEDHVVQRRAVRSVWWSIFHGHRATIIWDNNLPNYQFVDQKTRELTPAAETFAKLFNELREGLPKLLYHSRRTHDSIALHYSQASIQVHWLLDNLKNARQWMMHSGGDRHSHSTAIRNSWTKLLEDLGLQYDFVSRGQIEHGKLGEGEYRVFIMPQSIAASPQEAEQIRAFVRNGGLLVADSRAALMDEHGRDLGRGQLDDVFGISRRKGQTTAERIRGVIDEGPLRLAGKELHALRAGEVTVSVTEGKALALSGDVPLVIVNRFGNGRALFLNLEIADYPYQRLQPENNSSLPELLEGVLELSDVRPRVRVLRAGGQRLPGTEVVIFLNGACEHVAIFRNPQLDDGGWGDYPTMKARGWAGEIDTTLLERPEEVSVEWADARSTYDVRRRQHLGAIKSHKTTLDPWEPLVFTRSPQPLAPLRLELPSVVSAGQELHLTLRSEGPPLEGAVRIIRLEFETPEGQTPKALSQNLLMEATSLTERVPLAYNDPKGRWRVSANDVMTGKTAEAAFDLT